ncbi:MAG: hypothetical protein QM296_09165 [Bacillota bacterium]|nr:hypothetical protein [Bacillota bacterium]
MSRPRRFLALLLLAVLLTALPLILTTAGRLHADSEPVDQDSYIEGNFQTERVEYRDILDQATANLTPVYPRQEWLGFPYENAWHLETLVKSGDRVQEGQVLMRFRRDNDEARLRRLEYRLEDLREAWSLRSSELEHRRQELAASEPEGSLERRRLELESRRAAALHDREVFELERELVRLREDYETTELVAPFAGIVNRLTRLNENALVEPWQELVELRVDRGLLWHFDDSRGQFRYGQRVLVSYGPPRAPQEVEGEIVSVGRQLDLPQTTSGVLVRLIGVDPETEAGLTNVRLEGTSAELLHVLTVSRRAVYSQGGKSFVYLLEDGIMKKRFFVGGVENREFVQIVSGLDEGDTVVVR